MDKEQITLKDSILNKFVAIFPEDEWNLQWCILPDDIAPTYNIMRNGNKIGNIRLESFVELETMCGVDLDELIAAIVEMADGK